MKTIQEMKNVTNIPVVVADQDGLVMFINSKFTEVFGWSASEMVGDTLLKIIPPHLHDAHNLGFSRFLSTEKPTLMHKPLTLKAVNKQGVEFDAVHFILAEKIENRWHFASTINPA
jgi:PAS domain S-box-containing protein